MQSRQELSFADLERLKSRLSTETTALHNDAPEPYAYCSLSKLEIPGGGGTNLGGQPGTPAVRTDLRCVRRRCRQVILVRHLLAVVLQRMWDFTVILLLTKVGPRGSFSLVASYGITVNIVVALLSPPLGSMIDNINRLSSVVACAAVQNVCVVCCALSFMFLLLSRVGAGESSWIAAMVIVHVCGALNNLFYQQTTVILERDWVVVIAGSDDRWLRGISANLRQINLICTLFAPLLVALLHMISYRLVILFISGGNCLMILVQYSAFREVYRSMPELCKVSPGQTVCLWRQDPRSPQRFGREAQMANHGRYRGLCEGVVEFFAHSTTYIRQRSMLAGLALAMAYLTVLSFHYVMVSYLLMRGLSIRVVGVGQGLASASGILGTVFYDSVAGRLGAARSGLVGIWIQVCCLTVAIPCLLCPTWVGITDGRALLMFVFAVICSRFGLYAFDVAALQVFQELVAERDRNVIGGFQNTLQSIFELVSFIMVFCLWRPDQFGVSALVSYCMTVGAAIVYSAFVLREAIVRAQAQAQAKNSQSFESDMSEGPVEDEDEDDDVLETGRAPAPPELYSDRPSSLVLSRLSTIASVGSFESLCSTPVRAYTPTRSDLRAGPTLQERPSYEEEDDRE